MNVSAHLKYADRLAPHTLQKLRHRKKIGFLPDFWAWVLRSVCPWKYLQNEKAIVFLIGQTDGGGRPLHRRCTSLHADGGAFHSVTYGYRKYHCPLYAVVARSSHESLSMPVFLAPRRNRYHLPFRASPRTHWLAHTKRIC